MLPKRVCDHKRKTRPLFGMSLIEVLVSMVLLTLSLLTTYGVLLSVSKVSSNSYQQSSTNMLMTSLTNEMDDENVDFYAVYNTPSSPPNTITEDGTPTGNKIAYVRTPWCLDDMFRRRVYLNLYKGDQVDGNPIYQTATEVYVNEIRIDSGNETGPYVDTSQLPWMNDVYTNWDWCKAGWGDGWTAGTSAAAIPNTANDKLFQTYREGWNIYYIIPASPGDYTVQLYFAELDPTITASAPNLRRADIVIEDVTVKTDYSPRESTGATYVPDVQSFAVNSNDWWMTVELRRSASSNYNPRLNAIVVRKRVVF